MSRILILEDDPDFAELLTLDLEELGHETDVTDSGTDALFRLEREPFDLLLADIYIWKDGEYSKDGGLLLTGRLNQLRKLHREDRRAHLPIIVMSGAVTRPGQHNILNIAKNLGADDVLAKPFSPQVLHATIERLLTTAA